MLEIYAEMYVSVPVKWLLKLFSLNENWNTQQFFMKFCENPSSGTEVILFMKIEGWGRMEGWTLGTYSVLRRIANTHKVDNLCTDNWDYTVSRFPG
jgi:hypothetical protein